MPARTAIAIVNWGPAEAVFQCVQSFLDANTLVNDAIVIDNAHPARDTDAIQQRFPGINVLVPETNLGFAGGANAGIRWALKQGYDYVFIANNDLDVAKTTVALLVEFLDANADVGVAGALPCYRGSGSPHFAHAAIDWRRGKPMIEEGEPRCAKPYETEFATGCAILLRGVALERAGLFDENFFLYWEDVELCFRMREHGFTTMMVPAARALHDVSAATGHSSPMTLYYQTRNRLAFFHRHAPGAAVRRWLVLRVSVSRGLRGLMLLPRGKVPEARAYLFGILDYLAGRGGIRAEFHAR